MDRAHKKTGGHILWYAVIVFVLFPRSSFAQDSELEALKATVKNMQQQLQKALSRIDQLEKEKTTDTARLGQVEKSVRAVKSPPSSFNPAIGLVLDAIPEQQGKAGGAGAFRVQ